MLQGESPLPLHAGVMIVMNLKSLLQLSLRGLAATVLAVGPALADPVVGTWLTPPDRKDLTSHIEIRTCGPALCGKVLRAFDPSGQEVTTKNVGKELFWDMQPEGNGQYAGGTVWVPLLNINAKGSMALAGDRLTVKGCKLAACEEFVWSRVN
jgi:uncharacterized protein (DUF2147 family)